MWLFKLSRSVRRVLASRALECLQCGDFFIRHCLFHGRKEVFPISTQQYYDFQNRWIDPLMRISVLLTTSIHEPSRTVASLITDWRIDFQCLRTLRSNVFEHWWALLWASAISARALVSGAKDIRFRSISFNVPRIGHRCAAHFLLVRKHPQSMRGENFCQAHG